MDFWRFAEVADKSSIQISGSYNSVIVAGSFLLAVIAAFVMLIVIEKVRSDTDVSHRNAWSYFAALIMGFGIWSMHFTGMLAFQVPISMTLSWMGTLVSAVPGIIGSLIAVKALEQERFDVWSMQLAAFALALGIGTMHYTGMEAMQYDGVILRYDFGHFVLSIIFAHIFALAALYTYTWQSRSTLHLAVRRGLAALLIGTAVSYMHYTAMGASELYVRAGSHPLSNMAGYIGPGDSQHHAVFSSGVVAVDILLLLAASSIGIFLRTRIDTERQKVQESVQRENAVISALADALLVLDSKGNVDTYNVSAQRLFGAKHSPLESKNIVQLIPELGSFERLENWDDTILEQGSNGLTMQFQETSLAGRVLHFEVVFSRLFFSERIHYVALVRDISVRVEMEQRFRQAQKLESLGQLAAGIAHEINTPIQYVSDNVNFLGKAVGNLLDAVEMYKGVVTKCCPQEAADEIAGTLEKTKFSYIAEEAPISIEQSAEGLSRVAKIVRAMRTFSHASEGEFADANIQEALESTATICRNEWKYVAELTFEIDSNLPTVQVILDEFNQVILNLIVNAAHAIDERRQANDDVELGHITVAAKVVEDKLQVKISDDGSGIPEHVKERVFEPFFTTKAVGKGSGQGLNIAYLVIVEKHKGRIDLESTLGKGTTFIIEVPLQQKTLESAK